MTPGYQRRSQHEAAPRARAAQGHKSQSRCKKSPKASGAPALSSDKLRSSAFQLCSDEVSCMASLRPRLRAFGCPVMDCREVQTWRRLLQLALRRAPDLELCRFLVEGRRESESKGMRRRSSMSVQRLFCSVSWAAGGTPMVTARSTLALDSRLGRQVEAWTDQEGLRLLVQLRKDRQLVFEHREGHKATDIAGHKKAAHTVVLTGAVRSSAAEWRRPCFWRGSLARA